MECIWDYKLLLRLKFRPLCTGCAAEDEDKCCLKDAQCLEFMCISANAEGTWYSQGTGKKKKINPIPVNFSYPSNQPGNFS